MTLNEEVLWFESHIKPSANNLLVLWDKALYFRVVLDNDHPSVSLMIMTVEGSDSCFRVGYSKLPNLNLICLTFNNVIIYEKATL